MMIKPRVLFTVGLLLVSVETATAMLRGTRNAAAAATTAVDELHITMRSIRMLKATYSDDPNTDIIDNDVKTSKQTKTNALEPESEPSSEASEPPSFIVSTSPTSPPTTQPTHSPTTGPTSLPTSMPTSEPTLNPAANPTAFDSDVAVTCKPDGNTVLTQEESRIKTIACNAAKASCQAAVLAVKRSPELQNYFGCAGNLSEGAARKLFNRYASDSTLAAQLTLVANGGAILVTERQDVIKAACMAIGMAQSPPNTNPCCQGISGCISTTDPASAATPFMTVAVSACTGDSACKNIGPNPLILDSSCTGVSACESMNENDPDPTTAGITFVGEVSCTSALSCEAVGYRSYGDVTIHNSACTGPEACGSVGHRVPQSAPFFRFRSHIDIGSNACVGSRACKDAHSTVNRGSAGKLSGSLTISDGGCDGEGACEKMGFTDRMRTDINVPPGGCNGVDRCRGCMTKTECGTDEVYIISDANGACPKGGVETNYNPTGEKVDEYCVGKATLPTDCPTFFPTPLPTVTRRPTSAPTKSFEPSSIPTISSEPSFTPTISTEPSTTPTASSEPSSTPSISSGPSSSPTVSSEPSSAPTISLQPSSLPTISSEPSSIPTISSGPSFSPTVSSQPSSTPTLSLGPSSAPTVSSEPSFAPTISSEPSSVPSTAPTVFAGIGCLQIPGNVTSMFNPAAGDILCDSDTGTCTDFVAAVDALSDNKGLMIKSIFACDDSVPPGVVSQAVAQARFDKVKDDADVTAAILETVATKNLFTGSGAAVTDACGDDCCVGSNACSTSPSAGVMTVSEASCDGDEACLDVFPDTIILNSCNGDLACRIFGQFTSTQPNAAVKVGYRVIGPGSCNEGSGCGRAVRNIFGNVRVQTGSCSDVNACLDLGVRESQGDTTSPVVANIFIGKNACTGRQGCNAVHAGTGKARGSLTIENGACIGDAACTSAAFKNAAINDLVIKAGVCDASEASKCFGCVRKDMCNGDPTLTYTIADATTDCSGPNPLACS